jgi:hypothetical protein
MKSPKARAVNRADIKRRAGAPGDGDTKCAVSGCTNLTQRGAGNGLSQTYCKRHKEMLRRHGSTWRRSYSRHEIDPYRAASKNWTDANKDSHAVKVTLQCLDALLDTAGEVVTAHEVRWLPPKRKAQVALARFRETGRTGEDLLHIALALEAAYRELGPRANREFLHVQIAKVIHRAASGTHPVTSGGVKLKPSWPRPEGRMMRILGQQVREEARVFDMDGAVEAVMKAVTG